MAGVPSASTGNSQNQFPKSNAKSSKPETCPLYSSGFPEDLPLSIPRVHFFGSFSLARVSSNSRPLSFLGKLQKSQGHFSFSRARKRVEHWQIPVSKQAGWVHAWALTDETAQAVTRMVWHTCECLCKFARDIKSRNRYFILHICCILHVFDILMPQMDLLSFVREDSSSMAQFVAIVAPSRRHQAARTTRGGD